MMRCTVLLFAQLAEALDRRELSIELPEGGTVDDALDALCREHAPIADLRNRVAIAVDEAYAHGSTALRDGCTVALIPPVSGG